MLDGEQVYVYPFEIDVEQSEYYRMAIDGSNMMSGMYVYEDIAEEQKAAGIPDSMRMTREDFDLFLKALYAKNYKKFKKYYLPKFGPLPTKEEFDRYTQIRDGGMGMFGMETEAKIYKSKKFKKAIRANPYPFLAQSQNLDQDITPMLDPIPDGKYIQYYESFCLVQEDGTCEYINDQIAGYFNIKNNTLDGEATWVNLVGDTLKHGAFTEGLKTGEWILVYEDIKYFGPSYAEEFVETGEVPTDYRKTLVTFNKGVAEGEYQRFNGDGQSLEIGEYFDGEAIGEWTTFWQFPDEQYLEESNGKLPIHRHYVINSDDSLIVHPFVLRPGLYESWDYDEEEFNFFAFYELPELPNLYKPAFPKEDNFELEEEIYDDNFSEMEYYGDEYYGDEYYGEFDFEGLSGFGRSYFETRVFDPNKRERVDRGVIFDSLGAYPKYLNLYEVYYGNGQLAYRYELENGALKEEPTIYWDNGNVHDEIKFDADSNTYVRTIYDYDGKEFKTILYDSAGLYKYAGIYNEEDEFVEIDGLKFRSSSYSGVMTYTMPDSVLKDATAPNTILERQWDRMDTSLVSETFLNPETHASNYSSYNIYGDTILKWERIFSNEYDSWTGSRSQYVGPFEVRAVRSASLREWAEVDSLPILMANYYQAFDMDADHELFYENQRLTGPMEIVFKGKKLKLKKNKVTIPTNQKEWDKFSNELDMYHLFNGDFKLSKKHAELAKLYVNGRTRYQDFTTVYSGIFDPVFSNSWGESQGYDEDYYWEGDYEEDQERARTEKIEGYFLDGKPEGIWKSYDQWGNLRKEVSYTKGERDGISRTYDYVNPRDEDRYYYRDDEDSLPEKRTHYISGEYNYQNDLKEGKSYEYTWYGKKTLEENYKEGYLEGLSIERNEMAVSISEFRNGYRDGYSRTYLTLPGKDSILLFDLNFQNGALQGESVSYHTNGRISKRGFFLQGEPIDDYEGYDSLGFKYHYVKFEYGYPVEEKLWEENELSVRYTFNWEDSIVFIPMNLTESESLDALLVEAGLSAGWEYREYYGRQTIVDKAGVDYHLTKYYPNDTISRDGDIIEGNKSGHWEFFSYDGEKLYEVNYFDSLLVVNDSIKFNSKGIYTELDSAGNELFRAYIIEKSERFDCSHKDHYEVRQFYTISEVDDSLGRMNGEVFNFYDNGTLQSYGKMKDGLPEGEWRYYDPAGKLNKYGTYIQGKRDGRWLSGDLSKTKYLGDICLNPNMPDVEETMRFRENFLDIQIINYRLGRQKGSEYYDINMNRFIEYEEESDSEMETEIDDSGMEPGE
ncbi:MAG: hypothetical protein Crog4KO_29540 [Crocinitomicaceae bacterium]